MIFRVLTVFILTTFLAGCGGGSNSSDGPSGTTPSPHQKANIRVALPLVKSNDSATPHFLTRAGALPEDVDEIRVTILSLRGQVVATGQLSSGGTLSFSLDPLTDYTVIVEALFTQFPPTELLYRGSADVDRLAPGESRTVTVLMDLLISTQLIAPVAGLPVGGLTAGFRFKMTGLNNPNVRWFVDGIEGGNAIVGTIVNGLYTSPAMLPAEPTATVTIRAEPQYLPRFGKETTLLLVPEGIEFGAPVALDDHFELLEDTVLMNNVLGNDFDTNGDPLSLITTPVFSPTHGKVALSGNGDFTYTPNADFNGEDSFVYAVRDPDDNRGQARVAITVTPVNDPPAAKDDYFSVKMDETLSGNVLGNNGEGRDSDPDGDALTVIDLYPRNSTLGTIDYRSDGSFDYTPLRRSSAYTDRYLYTVSDPDGETDTGHVAIQVNQPPPVLIAIDDTYDADYAGYLPVEESYAHFCSSAGNVLGNDTYPPGAQAAIVSGLPGLSFQSNGTFEYLGYYENGRPPVSFSYRLVYDEFSSNPATVKIDFDQCDINLY